MKYYRQSLRETIDFKIIYYSIINANTLMAIMDIIINQFEMNPVRKLERLELILLLKLTMSALLFY